MKSTLHIGLRLFVSLLFFSNSEFVIADKDQKHKYLGVVMLPAYLVEENGGGFYSSMDLIDAENPVKLYSSPDSNKSFITLNKQYDLDTRLIQIGLHGINVYGEKSGWVKVKKRSNDNYYWIKTNDTGAFFEYHDLADGYHVLAINGDGYLLHTKPSITAPTARALGFGSGSKDEGVLYVAFLEHKLIDNVLWFKVAEMKTELCTTSYPGELGTTGWIKAHVEDGAPILNDFNVC